MQLCFFQAIYLHSAAENGRLDDVKYFLTDDDVDSTDEEGVSTALPDTQSKSSQVLSISLDPKCLPSLYQCPV